MHSNVVAMDQYLDDMINHIWKLRSRAIPYIGIMSLGESSSSGCLDRKSDICMCGL